MKETRPGRTKRKRMRLSEVGNEYGYLCPSCGKGCRLHIEAVIRTEVALYPNGAEDSGGDTEWDDDSSARCSNCDWQGTVAQLKTVEIEPATGLWV